LARYIGSVCRLCRREGMKLFLKGDRCLTEKCAIEKRNYAPGQHGKGGKGGRVKAKLQGYGLQLREKQKTKRLYGMLEGQFALTFDRASQEKGVVGETLLTKLERRLDNVVYRLGFGASRAQARQIVRHGHVRVNEKRLNIPSFQVKVGDVVTLSPRAAKNVLVAASVESVKGRGVPKWLELDAAAMKGKVLSMPARDDVNFPIQEQLIVELYSK
jgi:small subunit ribosomal protein S4